jgi:hypothetical protein
MKKIFSIFAAVLFAGSMMADVTSVADAIEIGNALQNGKTTDVDYTIKGVVVNPGYFSLRYKNQTVTIGDEITDATLLTIYQSAGVEAGDTVRVLAGDTVQVVGKIKKYADKKGNITIEVEKVQIAILAKAAGDRTVDFTPVTGKTLAEIVEIGQALADGAVSPLQYEVAGIVTEMINDKDNTYSDGGWGKFKNQSFWIAEEEGKDFEVYQGIGRLDSKDTEIHIGDKVKLVCQIKNYKGTIENADTKGYVDITEQAPQGIENVTLTEKAKKVVVDGNVYIIRNNKMYDLTGAQVR